MKTNIWILLLLITFSSCLNEDNFDEGFDEFDPENIDDQSSDEYSDEEGLLTSYRVQGDDISKIKDFNVSGNLVALQQDYGKHIKMWEFVKKLIPERERIRIGEFIVFFGNNDLAGYVEPVNENDLSNWRFGLAIDLADKLEEIDLTNFFTYVTIHEFGHVLTLNESQVDVNVDLSSCSTYFPGEGCANHNSYINAIYDLGWSDIYDGEDSNKDFYSQYPDRFVTDYAASNPAEDIAEVFSYFITQEDAPTGNSIADQKIQKLYDYPELVMLRNQLRNNATVRAMKAGSWKQNPYIKNYRCRKKHHKHHSASNF